jgi:hypothetical protein
MDRTQFGIFCVKKWFKFMPSRHFVKKTVRVTTVVEWFLGKTPQFCNIFPLFRQLRKIVKLPEFRKVILKRPLFRKWIFLFYHNSAAIFLFSHNSAAKVYIAKRTVKTSLRLLRWKYNWQQSAENLNLSTLKKFQSIYSNPFKRKINAGNACKSKFCCGIVVKYKFCCGIVVK